MRTLTTLALLSFLIASPATALAEGKGHDHDGFMNFGFGEEGTFKGLSDKEKKAFVDDRLTKWKAMTRDEKLAHIEKRRAERIKRLEEHYKGMSDADKVKFVDEKYKTLRERMDKHWSGMTDDEKIKFVEDKIVSRAEKFSKEKKGE
jgi:hypothetical protein